MLPHVTWRKDSPIIMMILVKLELKRASLLDGGCLVSSLWINQLNLGLYTLVRKSIFSLIFGQLGLLYQKRSLQTDMPNQSKWSLERDLASDLFLIGL